MCSDWLCCVVQSVGWWEVQFLGIVLYWFTVLLQALCSIYLASGTCLVISVAVRIWQCQLFLLPPVSLPHYRRPPPNFFPILVSTLVVAYQCLSFLALSFSGFLPATVVHLSVGRLLCQQSHNGASIYLDRLAYLEDGVEDALRIETNVPCYSVCCMVLYGVLYGGCMGAALDAQQ